jgi:hypothetical protein
MKYIYYILGTIFAIIVWYEIIVKGFFDDANALWSLVLFLMGDMKNLEDKIK